ncbi:class F sortase [Herbiconiux sp. SYSU D00978]|uniref:class F sortase n=1 Tax=Herbiconiux sp. SYSU D00978 TaxID=2812562 RepID=UPI001A95F85D|nr:class F sortase [Herbiconiux sp. SYSU D00978]
MAVLAAGVLLLSGCGAGGPAPEPSPAPSDGPVAVRTPPPDVPIASGDLVPPVEEDQPAALRIAELGIDMPVDPVGVQTDGWMEIPEDPAVGGWYRFGPAPGDDRGTAVIVAHVDSLVYGLGPFARLPELAPGAEVAVTSASGAEHRYRVSSVEQLPKLDLGATDVWSRDGDPALVLITCGGEFDREARSYEDNVVVTAERVP